MPFPLIPLGLLAGSAIAGGLSSRFAKKGGFQQLPTRSPGQLAGQNQALQMALQGLQNPSAGFAPIEQNARQQFESSTIPSIAERFTSLGGGQRSSGFQNALQQGAQGLESNLAAQKAQYGLQNQSLLQQLLGMGLQPSFENVWQGPEHTFASGALGGLSSGLGNMAGMGFMNQLMNPAQAAMGAASAGSQPGAQMFNQAPQGINPQMELQNYLGSSRQDPFQSPGQLSRETLGRLLSGYAPSQEMSPDTMLMNRLQNFRNTYSGPGLTTRIAQSAWPYNSLQ